MSSQKKRMSEALYRILIVDDDQAQAEMVVEYLRISGYKEIDHARDIRSLWKALEQYRYDIILLDYLLPDGNGLDVLAQLSKRDLPIPVIMLTGQGNERIAAQAIQHGASDFLLESGDYLVTLPTLIQKAVRAQRLKRSVQHSSERIRYQALLLNNVGDAIVVWDLAGRITYWNQAATSLFGYRAEERLGRPVADNYLTKFLPAVIPSEANQTEDSHEVRKFVNRVGKTNWVRSHLTPLTDQKENNRLIGYMDVSHDITRSVEAETALRESEARYRAIVEDYQTELICRFKPNGSLTFVNEVYCKFFGQPREHLLGMNFLYFVPETERTKLIEHLVSFSPEKNSAMIEHQVDIPGRGLRWLQRTDRAIFDTRGRISEFQSVGRDITENKVMSAQIQAAQSQIIQSSRLATIGEVASGLAHQIYNPLTTIIADAQILLRGLQEDHPARESAEAIEQAGWRLQQVVQRLMEFSRPEGETLEKISVAQTIQSALSLVYTNLENACCQVELNLDSELPQILGTQHQLETLWVNLLLLARDAANEKSNHTIIISARQDPANGVVVEISDDGRPIPPELIETVFEPNFYTSQTGRGTGLEFSICREIVRQHNGQISAHNTAPDQTTIRVHLPGV
jgi:two-component system cell cycle sensor histidine kinase/response regulator CckA